MSYSSRVVSLSGQKPYRVYRQPRRVRGDGSIQWDDASLDGGRPGGRRGAGIPRQLLRFTRRALFVAVVLAVAWLLVAFLSFRSAVKERNDALPANVRAALAPANGPVIAASHVTLLVGADTSAYRRRAGGETRSRADTLILLRTDVPSRTVSMLSIPRDLYVDIPGLGTEKINSAFYNGGLPLAIRTIRSLTGVEVNHVMQIDFDGFRNVVDALDGVDVDNPSYLNSGRHDFDGRHWVFRKGRIHLDGRNALAYSRMRVATDPKESTDLARARRQQRVVDAIVGEIASPATLRHPRDVPRAVVQPLLTDLNATQLGGVGFAKWWSKGSNNLRCRLGGDDAMRDGQSVLVPNEDNRAAVRMWLGKQAPVAPRNPLSAGCTRETPTG